METRNAQFTTTEFSREAATSSMPYLSAVSWGAIFAGAGAAAALSLILLLLGMGLGLSAVSPWAHAGVSGTTFGLTTILWITITSIIASAIGGYLAGRLRTRWIATHVDEVHFRDTAHGFLAWAIATLVTATLLTSVISSIVSGAAQAGASLAGAGIATAAAVAGTAAGAATNDGVKAESDNKSLTYFMDTLLRKDANAASNNASSNADSGASANDAPAPGTAAAKAEVTRIFVNALTTGKLPAEDIRYAGQVIAQRTNLNQQDAEKRVVDTFNTLQAKLREAETAARAAADQARKASAYGSLWLFISLLVGAFVASLTAVYGGRQRDL